MNRVSICDLRSIALALLPSVESRLGDCCVLRSNTNVDLFVAFGTACKSFGDSGVAKLRTLPQDATCDLGVVSDMLLDLTAKLRANPGVKSVAGCVTQLELNVGPTRTAADLSLL